MSIPFITAFHSTLKRINSYPHQYQYGFTTEEDFKEILLSKDIKAANLIYVQEILFRAHLAAITTVFRNEKWMLGVELAYEHSNYFGLAACGRGLLESSADSADCLLRIPKFIGKYFRDFQSGLKGDFDAGLIVAPELEDALIHYSHARRLEKNSKAPQTHQAKSVQDYLKSIEKPGTSIVKDLYSELCEITHPASPTVDIFTSQSSNDPETITVSHSSDRELITHLIEKHETAFSGMLQISLNAAILSLYTLNRFKDARFFTAGIEELDLAYISSFESIRTMMS